MEDDIYEQLREHFRVDSDKKIAKQPNFRRKVEARRAADYGESVENATVREQRIDRERLNDEIFDRKKNIQKPNKMNRYQMDRKKSLFRRLKKPKFTKMLNKIPGIGAILGTGMAFASGDANAAIDEADFMGKMGGGENDPERQFINQRMKEKEDNEARLDALRSLRK